MQEGSYSDSEERFEDRYSSSSDSDRRLKKRTMTQKNVVWVVRIALVYVRMVLRIVDKVTFRMISMDYFRMECRMVWTG